MRITRPWKTLTLAAIASLCLLMSGCSDDSPSDSNNGGWDIGTDVKEDSGADAGTCTPGETGWDDCNSCECDDEGRWICTMMGCIDDIQEDDGGSPDAGTCTPGETKQEDCNSCHCTDEGEWGCTLVECEPDPCAGKTCGEVCTTCVPDEDGNCPPVMEYCNADGQCEMGGGQECPADACEPGDTRQEDCNTCFCDTNGTWGCTEMACPDNKPCSGKVCGETCTTCDESLGEDCPAVVEYCDQDGQCRADVPSCGI
ncbi:hypothetical protein [Bradymonas sediminis]|nr:hypothetical protein [Bradymonas sediminis]TDP72205.1 pacifastin inhibitor LCMII [Bradymonas sediminis]